MWNSAIPSYNQARQWPRFQLANAEEKSPSSRSLSEREEPIDRSNTYKLTLTATGLCFSDKFKGSKRRLRGQAGAKHCRFATCREVVPLCCAATAASTGLKLPRRMTGC